MAPKDIYSMVLNGIQTTDTNWENINLKWDNISDKPDLTNLTVKWENITGAPDYNFDWRNF